MSDILLGILTPISTPTITVKTTEATTMAFKQVLTLSKLESIRIAIRANPLAGKGAYSVDQLENDAILALYNTAVMESNKETKESEEASYRRALDGVGRVIGGSVGDGVAVMTIAPTFGISKPKDQ